MSSVGEMLRRERLRTGLDLERISQETKISVRMLELIENDQFQQLPGAVFARSFVRQYARALGLDEEEFVRELDRTFEPPAQPPPGPAVIANMHSGIDFPRMAQLGGAAGRLRLGSWVSSLGMVVLVILACSAVYTWWQTPRHGPAAQTADRVASDPRPAAPRDPAHVPPALQKNASMEAPAASVPPSAPAPAKGGVTIALTAAEPTWVRATSNDKVVFSGILQPNETKALSAPEKMTLKIGNAGALSISLNGKSIPAVGPRGQVRTVQLLPDGEVQLVPPVRVEPEETSTPRSPQTL